MAEPTTLGGSENDDTIPITAAELATYSAIDTGIGDDTLILAEGGTFDFSGIDVSNLESIVSDGANVEVIFDDADTAKLVAGLPGSFDRVEITVSGRLPTDLAQGFLARGIEAFEATDDEFVFVGGLTPGGAPGDPVFASIDVTVTDRPGGTVYRWDSIFRAYDTDGTFRQEIKTLDDGRTVERTYDVAGRLTSTTVEKTDGTFIGRTYDEAGDVIGKTIDDGAILTDILFEDGVRTGISKEDTAGDAKPWQTLEITFDPVTGIKDFQRKVMDSSEVFVRGFEGQQVLVMGEATEIASGGAGPDIFAFTASLGGIDRIRDFDAAGSDMLDMGELGITDAAGLTDLGAIREVNGNVYVDYAQIDPTASGQLIIQNATIADLAFI